MFTRCQFIWACSGFDFTNISTLVVVVDIFGCLFFLINMVCNETFLLMAGDIGKNMVCSVEYVYSVKFCI